MSPTEKRQESPRGNLLLALSHGWTIYCFRKQPFSLMSFKVKSTIISIDQCRNQNKNLETRKKLQNFSFCSDDRQICFADSSNSKIGKCDLGAKRNLDFNDAQIRIQRSTHAIIRMTGFVIIDANLHDHYKTSQELQMLSRSLPECQSLNLKVSIFLE